MASNYNGVPRPPVVFCRDGEARVVVRRETYEDLTARDVDGSIRSASGCSAAARSVAPSPSCSRERADAVEAATGRRPELAGTLTRSEGDFDEILAAPDLIVELIGGTEPAREYVLAALRAGSRSSPPTSSSSPSTATSCSPPPARPASSCASRPPSPG